MGIQGHTYLSVCLPLLQGDHGHTGGIPSSFRAKYLLWLFYGEG
jgi:hypothetical protein